MSENKTTLFHSLSFADARAAIAFLEQVGFERRALYWEDESAGVVAHAEYAWGRCGGLMFGSVRESSPFARESGGGKCYLVVADDAEVDGVHARALAAGAVSIQEPIDVDYGGRSAGFRDAEGNLYSVGSYPGS